MRSWRIARLEQFPAYNLSRLAEAHARAGKSERAIELGAEAVAEVNRSGERWWEAEAQRLRGEILLKTSPAYHEEAETCFRKALECARRQEAKLWELHAAHSLATLWSAEGHPDEARELLLAIYRAFTDGFDIANLRFAKETLEQLGSPARGRAPSASRAK